MKAIKIYFVDDEILPIKYFLSLLPEDGYQVVGVQTSPHRAYTEILELQPDIIFIDVSMPVMNGLELSKKLLKKNRLFKIILLTSYAEFEYVQQGLQIGVSAYLLKHQVSAEILQEAIDKYASLASKERENEIYFLRKNMEAFLRSSVTESGDWDTYGKAEGYVLLDILEDHPLYLAERDIPFSDLQFSTLEGSRYPGDLLCRVVVRMVPGHWVAVLCIENTIRMNGMPALLNGAAEQMKVAFQALGISVSILMSHVTTSFYELPMLYHKFHECRRRLFFYGPGAVIQLEKLSKVKPLKEADCSALFAPVLAKLENPHGEAVAQVRKILLEQVECSTDYSYLALLRQLWLSANLFLTEYGRAMPPQSEAPPFRSAGEAIDWFCTVLGDAAEQLARQKERPYSPVVFRAIRYLEKDYGENLSVRMVAEVCDIGEHQLQKLFKKETGMTVVDYLTNLRIEKAKKLLREGTRKMVDIYQAVGFSSSQYFSSVFKKIEGVSPSEFQKTWGRP